MKNIASVDPLLPITPNKEQWNTYIAHDESGMDTCESGIIVKTFFLSYTHNITEPNQKNNTTDPLYRAVKELLCMIFW